MRVIERSPNIHHIRSPLALWIQDQVCRRIKGPHRLGRNRGVITVAVERDKNAEIAVISLYSLDDDVVALCGRDVELVGDFLLYVGCVVHDDVHVVGVEVYHGIVGCAHVDDSEAIVLADFEWVVCTLTIVEQDAVGGGRGAEGVVGTEEAFS